MSLETGRQSVPDAPRHPSLLLFGNILKQYRKDVAISFAAATLAAIAILANPSPTNPESQVNTIPSTNNNPITIPWGPGSENVDPVKLAVSLALVGLFVTIAVEEIVNEDSNGNK